MPHIRFDYPDRVMTVELKNIKYSDFASEETHCYEATLYIDGTMVGTVGNDGHGGPDWFHQKSEAALAVYQDANLWISANIKYTDGESELPPLMKDIDWVCADLINDWFYERDLKSAMRNKVLFIDEAGKCHQYAWKGLRKLTERHIESVRPRLANLGITALNDMPFDEALKAYREALS